MAKCPLAGVYLLGGGATAATAPMGVSKICNNKNWALKTKAEDAAPPVDKQNWSTIEFKLTF